jgi:hypothetical protein
MTLQVGCRAQPWPQCCSAEEQNPEWTNKNSIWMALDCLFKTAHIRFDDDPGMTIPKSPTPSGLAARVARSPSVET